MIHQCNQCKKVKMGSFWMPWVKLKREGEEAEVVCPTCYDHVRLPKTNREKRIILPRTII